MTKTRPPHILIDGNSPQLKRIIHIDPHDPSAADQVAVLQEGGLIYDPATTVLVLIQAIGTLRGGMILMGAEEGGQPRRHLSLARRVSRLDIARSDGIGRGNQ